MTLAAFMPLTTRGMALAMEGSLRSIMLQVIVSFDVRLMMLPFDLFIVGLR
ncbi:hypothetical protein D9M73_266210 [compost metagenome]